MKTDGDNQCDIVNQDNQAQRWSLLSYWLVLAVGVPVWWMMTSIERHALPLYTINQLIKSSTNVNHNSSDTANDPIRVKGYPGYQISFTVISTGDNCVNLYDAYNEHMAGPLAHLSTTMAYFKVDLQCRLHAVEAGKTVETFLRSDWNLANSISSLPIINMVLYDGEHSENLPKSFLYPQWGGVYLYNANQEGDTPDNVMATFKTHLYGLLGIHSSDLSTWLESETQRCRQEAISSLRSLLHIISTSPNMPVPKQVADSVHAAVSFLHSDDNDDKTTVVDQFGRARNALDAAEAAFFHPAMLARQYFPQEHILAVYVPLFVPLLMPLVVQTVKTLRGIV